MPNVSVPLIAVPPSLATTSNRSSLYKTLFILGLKEAGERDGLPTISLDGLPRVAIFFPDAAHAKLDSFADRHELTIQAAFASLCTLGLQKRQQQHVDMNARVLLADAPPFAGAHPGQAAFYRQAMASLMANRIALNEASTGSGKSRAMAAVAIQQAAGRKTPVVITAPTLIVVAQLWSELQTLVHQGMGKGLRIAFFPGIGEFASKEKIRDYLDEQENPDPGIRAWFDAGGPIQRTPSESPLIHALLKQCEGQIELSFMMDDLRSVATTADPDDFAFDDGDDAIVQKVRSSAAKADIILCTHAMLARSHMSRWAAVPEPAVLIVDEAHDFERNVASVYSNRVSLNSLRRQLGDLPGADSGRSQVGKAISATQTLIDALRHINVDVAGDSARIDVMLPDGVLDALLDLDAALRAKSVVSAKRRAISSAADALRAAVAAATGKERLRATFEFSPDRRFPSIMVGRSSIAAVLGDIWRTASGGVLLASATLYVPDEYGNSKADYITDLLALPRSRIDAHPPIVEKWVIGIPVMHTPDAALAATLERPGKDSRNAHTEQQWLGALATQIDRILLTARGGTLVLMTSFDQIRQVGEKLTTNRPVIAQSDVETFALAQQRFRRHAYEGERPVLLACGSAWTGVNLVDERMLLTPEKDIMLTDLVIACCPIGLNQSPSMKARFEKQGTLPVIKEALMTLRQGLGRLVRNPNLRDRHIWVLDGRIWSDWPKMRQFTLPARFILNSYQRKVTFTRSGSAYPQRDRAVAAELLQ